MIDLKAARDRVERRLKSRAEKRAGKGSAWTEAAHRDDLCVRAILDALDSVTAERDAFATRMAVPNAWTKAICDTLAENPNFMGETFRALAFTGGYGCYETFDLVEGFTPVVPNEKLFKAMWGRSPGDSCDRLELERFQAYHNAKIGLLVAWHWDGDGTLYFSSDVLNRAVVNTDCKKDYDWAFTHEMTPQPSQSKGE